MLRYLARVANHCADDTDLANGCMEVKGSSQTLIIESMQAEGTVAEQIAPAALS